MRLTALLVCTGSLVAAPYALGSRVLAWAGPRAAITTGLGALVGASWSVVVLLLAVIDPPELPAREIPALIGRCVDAAWEFLAHPVGHWPQIVAAVALLALGGRLGYAAMATLLDARRTRRQLERIGTAFGGFTLVESPEPMAYTVGVRHRLVVVSSGLLAELDDGERAAVLAHERAHVRGWHTALLLAARIVVRAFGSFPPARAATRQLVLGLETAADDAAVNEVGDPVIVARALLRLAEQPTPELPASGLGASESDVVMRVRRLTSPDKRRRRSLGMSATGATLLLLISLLMILPATRRTVSAAAVRDEAHEMCHLPHPADVEAASHA